MNAQGSSIIDTSYVDDLIAEVNGVRLCAELQALAKRAIASVQAHLNALAGQSQALALFKELMEIPKDLASALTWIEKVIAAQIAPAYQAFLNVEAQIVALTAKLAELVAAIAAAAGNLVACAVSLPALVFPALA